MKTKRCTKCDETKSADKFNKDKTSKDGLGYYCRLCNKINVKKWSMTEKGKTSSRKSLLEKYNITLKEYEKRFAAQGGVCAICGKSETRKNQYGLRRLAVDHDHKTGKVRGLLCSKCNQGIGYFNEDIKILWETIKYLGDK